MCWITGIHNRKGSRQRGGQVLYSDQAIACLLMLRAVFQLPYRQTEGLGQSLMDLLEAGVTVPDYTTVCKRSAELAVSLPTSHPDEAKHIVVDSTGLKVYGEGEWKVRQHGCSKRRTWRKLHLSVDEATQQIQAAGLTEAGVDDAEAGRQLLDDTPGPIVQVSGDGTYDKGSSTTPALHGGWSACSTAPTQRAHLAAWQRVPAALAARPKSAAHAARRAEALEAGSGLSSPFAGRDCRVSFQDHLWQSLERAYYAPADH